MGKPRFGEVRCTYILHVPERCSFQIFPPNIIRRFSFISFYQLGDCGKGDCLHLRVFVDLRQGLTIITKVHMEDNSTDVV